VANVGVRGISANCSKSAETGYQERKGEIKVIVCAEMENKELLFSYFVKNGVASGERGYGSTSKVGIA
jgi:hypothetical protein